MSPATQRLVGVLTKIRMAQLQGEKIDGAELVQATRGLAQAAAFRAGLDRQGVPDCHQDLLRFLCEGLNEPDCDVDSLAGKASIVAYRSAGRVAMRQRRRQGEEFNEEAFPSTEPDPAKLYELVESADEVKRAMEVLRQKNPNHHTALELHLQGKSDKEIIEHFRERGIETTNVRMWRKRGKEFIIRCTKGAIYG